MNTSENKQEKNKSLEVSELEDINGGIYTLTKGKRQEGFRSAGFNDTYAGKENEIFE